MFACVWAESGPGPVWPSCADTATLQIQAHAFANNATPALTWRGQSVNKKSIICLDKNFKKFITSMQTGNEDVIAFNWLA